MATIHGVDGQEDAYWTITKTNRNLSPCVSCTLGISLRLPLRLIFRQMHPNSINVRLINLCASDKNHLTKSGAARLQEYILKLMTASYMIHLDFLPIPVTISLRPARRTLNHFQVTSPTAERMLIYQTVPIYM